MGYVGWDEGATCCILFFPGGEFLGTYRDHFIQPSHLKGK